MKGQKMSHKHPWSNINGTTLAQLDNDAGFDIAVFCKGSYETLEDADNSGGLYRVSNTIYGRSNMEDVIDAMRTAADCMDGNNLLEFVYRLAGSMPEQVEVPPPMATRSSVGGCVEYIHHDSSAPGLYASITDNSGKALPKNPETESLIFGVYSHDDRVQVGDTVHLTGRAGLLTWYKENIGYSPDEESGGDTPIFELIQSVAAHLMFNAQGGLDAPEVSLMTLPELIQTFPEVGFSESDGAQFDCPEGSANGKFICIVRDDMCITNPYLTSNGMEDAIPEFDYGISDRAASCMLLANKDRLSQIEPVQVAINTMSDEAIDDMLSKAADAALHSGCLFIQEAIKQTDGGVAGMFFSGDRHKSQLIDMFRGYLILEQNIATT